MRVCFLTARGEPPEITARCLGGQQTYKVVLAPMNGSGESNKLLTSIEPGQPTALVARVYDQTGQLAPNVPVKLESTVIVKSGGHNHDDGARHTQHMGKLAPVPPSSGTIDQTGKVLTGNTGTGGLSFSFTAPAIAGDHDLVASCTDGKNCNPEGPKQVWVGIKDLVALYDTHLYTLVGSNGDHPKNHYLTWPATGSMVRLAELYREAFPDDPPLHLNDASLERGGLFDIDIVKTPWQTPHPTHRKGTEIDIRANPQVNPDTAIPEGNFFDFERFVERQLRGTFCGAGGQNIAYAGQAIQHYHVCLMGGNCCSGGN